MLYSLDCASGNKLGLLDKPKEIPLGNKKLMNRKSQLERLK